MKDIKKRFIDILFEPDDEEDDEIFEEPVKAEPSKKETNYGTRMISLRMPQKHAIILLQGKSRDVALAASEKSCSSLGQLLKLFRFATDYWFWL